MAVIIGEVWSGSGSPAHLKVWHAQVWLSSCQHWWADLITAILRFDCRDLPTPRSWCNCCLAKGCVECWLVNIEEPRFICGDLSTLSWWSSRHLAVIGTTPCKEGQQSSMCTSDPGGGRLSLKLADLGSLLKGAIGGYSEELAGVHKLLDHHWQDNADWPVLLGRFWMSGEEDAIEKAWRQWRIWGWEVKVLHVGE